MQKFTGPRERQTIAARSCVHAGWCNGVGCWDAQAVVVVLCNTMSVPPDIGIVT